MGRLRRLALPAALLVAAYWALFGGEYDVLEVRKARTERAVEAAEVARLEAEIDSLAARADSLEHDPEALERIARERYGLIRDGEVLYRFAPAEGEPSGSAEVEPAP